MYSATELPILIVGLGPTGETAACLLGQLGIPVVAIERETEVCPFPRAGALDGEALRVFQSLGIYTEIEKTLTLNQEVEFVDADGRRLLRVRPEAYPYAPTTLAFFHQPTVSRILRQHLDTLPNVKIRTGCEYVRATQLNDRVTVAARDRQSGDESTLAASWVLACDGGDSLIRRDLGIGNPGRTYSSTWAVVDVELKKPPRARRFRFHCDPARPGVSTYLACKHFRWEWRIGTGDTDPFDARRIEQLAKRDGVGDFEVIRQATYTYHSRIAGAWRSGRFFLLGDAAHISPPFGGQGMSNGIRDAANLCWKLAAVTSGVATDRLLDTYESERRPQVRSLNRIAEIAGRIVETRGRTIAAARNLFLKHMAAPLLGSVLTENRLMYPRRIRTGHVGAGKNAGRLFIQPTLLTRDGGSIWLDDLLGYDWAIVGWRCEPAEYVDHDSTKKMKIISTGPAGAGFAYTDVTGSLGDWFGHEPRCILLRPDRVVFAEVRPEAVNDALDAALTC